MPEYKIFELPYMGGADEYQCDVLEGGKTRFSLIAILSSTERATAQARQSIISRTEGKEKLKAFCLFKAQEIYNDDKFEEGSTIKIFFSPSW